MASATTSRCGAGLHRKLQTARFGSWAGSPAERTLPGQIQDTVHCAPGIRASHTDACDDDGQLMLTDGDAVTITVPNTTILQQNDRYRESRTAPRSCFSTPATFKTIGASDDHWVDLISQFESENPAG